MGRPPAVTGISCRSSEAGEAGISWVRRSLLVVGKKAEGVAKVEDAEWVEAINGVPTRASVRGSLRGREERGD